MPNLQPLKSNFLIELKLSEILSNIPQYPATPEYRLQCSNKHQVVEKIKERFKDKQIIELDGARIKFRNGWALVRPSHTEEKISVRMEAKSKESLQQIKSKIMDSVKEFIK